MRLHFNHKYLYCDNGGRLDPASSTMVVEGYRDKHSNDYDDMYCDNIRAVATLQL